MLERNIDLPELWKKKKMWGRLKQFDAYPKTLEDFRVKTTIGASSRSGYSRVGISGDPPHDLYCLSSSSVTIVSGAIILILFLSEFAYFMSTDVSAASTDGHLLPLCTPSSLYLQVREELFVDTSRGEKLRINFDIVFHRMPCVCE